MSGDVVTIGSLYSGIAGLELGVLAAFIEAEVPARIAWQCEIDPFCSRVLAHHFPEVQRFSDVETVSHPPRVDVLCSGFACQDVSAAGLGKGLGVETRSGFTLRHLLRIIDEITPEWLVVENVASGAKRWLPRVVWELRSRGYRPQAVPLGAIDIGAPHCRRRIFVVAHRACTRLEVERVEQAQGEQSAAERSRSPGTGPSTLAHGHGHGREGERSGGLFDGERPALGNDAHGRGGEAGQMQLRDEPGWSRGEGGAGPGVAGNNGTKHDRRASQSGVGTLAHGLPFDVAGHPFPAGRGEQQHPWESPRALEGNVKVPDRPAKLRACGNAVVPQCGLVVGRVLIHEASKVSPSVSPNRNVKE